MKALALKINTYKTSVDIVNNNNLEKRILHMMLVALGSLALCYVVFLGNTVFNIVERQSLSRESRTLSNEVGQLELQYLAMSNKVDLTLASSLGFSDNKNKQYATRKSSESFGSIKFTKNEL